MKPLESIRFHQPPRDIQLARTGVLPADWDEQLRQAHTAGYERGVIDGEKALSEQLLRQRNELMQLHSGAVAALQDAVPEVVRQSEDALIALAFEIAQKLVVELPITRETVAATVREALSQVEGATEFSVALHPEDFALLESHTALLGSAAAGRQVRFTASHEITRGGCVVQTRFGIIDARRETKLARVAESLALA